MIPYGRIVGVDLVSSAKRLGGQIFFLPKMRFRLSFTCLIALVQ